MLFRIVRFIKGLFTTPLSDCDKNEFAVSINRINIARAKINNTDIRHNRSYYASDSLCNKQGKPF